MSFTEQEISYLRSQPLARIATVGPDGQPDAAPVGFEFDGTYFYVGDIDPAKTRKFRNVRAGNNKRRRLRDGAKLADGAFAPAERVLHAAPRPVSSPKISATTSDML